MKLKKSRKNNKRKSKKSKNLIGGVEQQPPSSHPGRVHIDNLVVDNEYEFVIQFPDETEQRIYRGTLMPLTHQNIQDPPLRLSNYTRNGVPQEGFVTFPLSFIQTEPQPQQPSGGGKKKKKTQKRKSKRSKKGGEGCGCDGSKELMKLLKMKGGNNLGDTKYYYGLNNQETYELPKSSSIHGGKKKRKSIKMKGGNIMLRSYDNFFLNFPDTKGVNQASDIMGGKTIESSAPYTHEKVEINQNRIA